MANPLQELKDQCIRLGYQNALGDIAKLVDSNKEFITTANLLIMIMSLSNNLGSINYEKVKKDLATP